MKVFDSVFLLLITVAYIVFITALDFIPLPMKFVMYAPVMIFVTYWAITAFRM